MSRCPFISRVSVQFIAKAGQSLNYYAQNCPVIKGFANSVVKTFER